MCISSSGEAVSTFSRAVLINKVLRRGLVCLGLSWFVAHSNYEISVILNRWSDVKEASSMALQTLLSFNLASKDKYSDKLIS